MDNIISTCSVVRFISDNATLFGVLVALIVYITSLKFRSDDEKNKNSEFYLSRATEGLEIFHDLLKDRNNSRLVWVQAARVLLDTEAISKKITNKAHKSIYSFKRDHMRHRLYSILNPTNMETGQEEPLPSSFFYGGDAWKNGVDIDDAARASTEKSTAYAIKPYTPNTMPIHSSLSEKSVVAVYEFLDFPEDYEDRLKVVKIWDLSKERPPNHSYESAWKYLKHKKDHWVHGGMCYPKGDEEAKAKEEQRVYGPNA